jgi:hypothetical protein
MQVEKLQKAAKLLSTIINDASPTVLYRSVELSETSVRATSEYGNIEVFLEDTGPKEPFLFVGAAFCDVVNSLPKDAELTMSREGNQIAWKCGRAKGTWISQPIKDSLPLIQHDSFPWTPSPELQKALDLGASSCVAAAAAIGLYGVIAKVDGEILRFLSSSGGNFSMASIDKAGYPGGDFTLRPPTPKTLSSLLSAGENVTMDITAEGIFILSDGFVAQLALAAPLEGNLVKIAKRFNAKACTVKIDPEGVKTFLIRARALTEKSTEAKVILKVEAGELLLEHRGIASSLEETFLAEGLDPSISFSSVALPVGGFIQALGHADTVTLDYLPNNVLVLSGENPDFVQIISSGFKK